MERNIIIMDKKEFEKIIQCAKIKNPLIFSLEADCKPKIDQIEKIEKYYNIIFPKSYKDFLLQYGGGYFAFTVVYSMDWQSPFYIINNVNKEFVNANKFLPIIDFETGDLAGFRVHNETCEDSILIYNHEEKVISDLKLDFYSALAKYGFRFC